MHPSRAPCRSALVALATGLALLAPPAALAQAGGCPEGMKALTGGRFTLADGSAVAEVEALCLDVSEVTAAAYAACVARGACEDAGLRCGKSATYGAKAKAEHPVNCVTWLDADRYCRAQGKRLPSEAEWEWAARGRLRALTYPWGSAPPADRACWDGAGSTLGKGGRNETCPVGAFPAGDSPDGLHDLGGNVREWTETKVGRDRVVRGGSWGDSLPEFVAAGFRGMNKQDERFEITGFRCAAAPGSLPVRGAARDVPLPPPPVVRAPPARREPVRAEPARFEATRAAPAAKVAATKPPAGEEEDLEEEGTIVAPLDREPSAAPPAKAAPPPAPPSAPKVARPDPPKPPPPAPVPAPAAKPAPRAPVEIGEIKIERLSGGP